MNGYVYNIETREIATKITNVRACNDTIVKGENSMAVIGTGQYIITNLEYSEGDILPESIEDRRSEVPVLPIQY